MVSSSSAAEGMGKPVTCAVQLLSPALSEANGRGALKNNADASESGFLNSLSSDDTSSLNSNVDHLTVPDKPTGSKMTDRGKSKKLLLFFNMILFIYFWLCWVFVALRAAFSSCSELRPLSSCGVWPSPYGGFSCCRAQRLGHVGSALVAPGLQSTDSIAVAHGLSCSVACGILLE